ncbi:MAG: type II secretion system protein GspE, partial [archaeon]|nr:type II secretion system protein GspE [archaeon]
MNSLRKKIGDILITKGLISTEQLNSALDEQKISGGKLGQILVEKKFISEDQLAEAISERLEIQKISLKSLVIDPRIISKVPVELARRYELIPVFKIGDMMTVAMADPLNIIAIDELKYLSKCNIKRVIASASDI